MRWVLFAAASLLIAGCSSGTPAESPTATTSTTTDAQPVLPVAPPTTDTMHLLDAPHATAAAPTGDQDIRVPVPAFADAVAGALQGGGSSGVSWTIPRQQLMLVEGNATLWVDVHGTVTNPSTGGCFWSLFLLVKDANGSQMGSSSNCIHEENVVAPGIRELAFTFPRVDVRQIISEEFTLTLNSAGTYAPGSGIDVLTGSVAHDSRVSLRGLALTLDTQTYL